MNYSSSNRGFPAGNPIANALVIVVGALAIGASIVLGFFAFVVLGSILMVLAAIIGIRLWWFKRRLRNTVDAVTREGTGAQGENGVIEGEYHVVIEERDEREP